MSSIIEPTICYKCENFSNKEPNSARKDCFYNHFCLVSPVEKYLDYVTGEMLPDQKWKYCRDVNDGNCKQFKPK